MQSYGKLGAPPNWPPAPLPAHRAYRPVGRSYAPEGMLASGPPPSRRGRHPGGWLTLFPSCKLFPPACCKPYGLEAEQETGL